MCTIIISKKTGNLNKAVADTAAANNPHGYGIGVIKDVSHTYGGDKGIVECFKSLEHTPGTLIGSSAMQSFGRNYVRGYMVHFRYATHGEISLINTQPFKSANNEWLFAHNGIFWDYAKKDSIKSDSLLFFEQIQHFTLNELKKEWKNIKKYAEQCNSKVAILAENGDIFHTKGFMYDTKHEIIVSNTAYTNDFSNLIKI